MGYDDGVDFKGFVISAAADIAESRANQYVDRKIAELRRELAGDHDQAKAEKERLAAELAIVRRQRDEFGLLLDEVGGVARDLTERAARLGSAVMESDCGVTCGEFFELTNTLLSIHNRAGRAAAKS